MQIELNLNTIIVMHYKKGQEWETHARTLAKKELVLLPPPVFWLSIDWIQNLLQQPPPPPPTHKANHFSQLRGRRMKRMGGWKKRGKRMSAIVQINWSQRKCVCVCVVHITDGCWNSAAQSPSLRFWWQCTTVVLFLTAKTKAETEAKETVSHWKVKIISWKKRNSHSRVTV